MTNSHSKKCKWIHVLFFVSAILLVILLRFAIMPITPIKSDLSEVVIKEKMGQDRIPRFTEISTPFTHEYNPDTPPFMGSALVDMNNDGIDEVFVGGGGGQDDALLSFKGNHFENIINSSGLSDSEATISALSFDLDKDELVDMIITRPSGVYWYRQIKGGKFEKKEIEVDFEEYGRPFSVTLGDINNDNHADLYIHTFIDMKKFKPATFNNPSNVTMNHLLVNNGDNTFTDKTRESGLLYRQNTFTGAFIDLDNDNYQDLVISPNTDRIRIYKNNGDESFTEVVVPSKKGFFMGLAIDDIDNDGDPDMFFSNSGTTIPKRISRGDLESIDELSTEWMLLKNNGDMTFTDATSTTELDGYEFAWGGIFADLNLNGRSDLIVMENYIKWPPHKFKKLPGRVFLQSDTGTFQSSAQATGLENKHYGIAPLVSDFNQDGYPDLVYINLDGPIRAFLNNGGANHYLTIRFPDNIDAIGVKARVQLENGESYTKMFVPGLGLLSDQSSSITFGLGNQSQIRSVELEKNGQVQRIADVKLGSVINIE